MLSLQYTKEKLDALLSPRIKIYEERLKKPWLQRRLEYLQTSFGEAGYKRTKDFLADMDKKEIKTTEDLIKLIAQEKYQTGSSMRNILRSTVVEVCQFTAQHLALIEDEIRGEFSATKNRFAPIALMNIQVQILDRVFENIIASKDCGKSYLQELNKRLHVKRGNTMMMENRY